MNRKSRQKVLLRRLKRDSGVFSCKSRLTETEFFVLDAVIYQCVFGDAWFGGGWPKWLLFNALSSVSVKCFLIFSLGVKALTAAIKSVLNAMWMIDYRCLMRDITNGFIMHTHSLVKKTLDTLNGVIVIAASATWRRRLVCVQYVRNDPSRWRCSC